MQEKINDTPLYANVKRVVNEDGSLAAIEINYLTFYAHNGHYDIGYVGLLKVGISYASRLPNVLILQTRQPSNRLQGGGMPELKCSRC